MKVTLVGTGAMHSKYNSASTLINSDLIVDMPNGILKQLLKNDYDIKKIKTILVTHFHGDHISDIPFFIIFLEKYANDNYTPIINIVGPKGIKDAIDKLFDAYSFGHNNIVKINYLELTDDEINIDNYKIKSYSVLHNPIDKASGYIINDKLALTGDAALCDNVEKIFDDSEIIISDLSYLIGKDTHLGANNIEYLIKKYNKKVIGTHLRDETRVELLNNPLNNIKIVDDFYEFYVE